MSFDPAAVRKHNLALLKKHGFSVAPGLPLSDQSRLRPADEIAGRLAALNALFIYVTAPESFCSESTLRAHIDTNNLAQHLTDEEREGLALPRKEASESLDASIGWKTENAYTLAWILGSPSAPAAPPFDGQLLAPPAIIPDAPKPGSDYAAWRATLTPRPYPEVAALEDLFYCCHNAVRSAQLEFMQNGRQHPKRYTTIPAGFDPLTNGGVIHERRHALTWSINPDDSWDETDLST